MGRTTVERVLLSGSTDGKQIKVAATATPGTTIHTAHATSTDYVTLYCANSDTNDRKLTIEWGGTTAPDDLIELVIPAEHGLILVVPALPLTNGLVIKAFAASANLLLISGYVERATVQ